MTRRSRAASTLTRLSSAPLALVFHLGCVATSNDAENESTSVTKSDQDSGAEDEGTGSETTEATSTSEVVGDDRTDASSSEPNDETEAAPVTDMATVDEVDSGGAYDDSLDTTSDVIEPEELHADAGARQPDCTSVCTPLVEGCGGTLEDCVDECERDAAHSASCGQQGEWSALLDCCSEASWAGCDEQSFDACQKDACGSLRPEGAAEGCGQALCGNGKLDPDEVCDDQNNQDGDGCSADCSHIEPNW